MALRNLQEQVLYLTQELEKIKQSLGNALPDPIPGPPGDPGEQGVQGEPGPQGFGIIGNGTQLPSYASNGNYFILRTSGIDGIDLVLYKCINNHWVAQYSLRGNQGPVGDSADVTANPDIAYSESLYKITVDGVTYEVLSSDDRNKLNIISYVGGSWLLTSPIIVADNITIYTGKTLYNDGTIDSAVGNIKLTNLGQIKDSFNNPIVICENFKDSHNNARFIEGDVTTPAKTGVTYTYAKWSLSGSHLMIVICATIENGTTWNNEYFASITDLPDYVKSKIIPVWANEFILQQKFSAFDNSWNVQELNVTLAKQSVSPYNVYLYQPGNVTFSSEKHIRIQFDLLIDME